MSSRYTKQYYEDMARLLKGHILEKDKDAKTRTPIGQSMVCLAKDFADLFATDNPQRCTHCGTAQPSNPVCSDGSGILPHHLSGFDRAAFLKACGLEPEPDVLAELEEKADHWEEGYPQGDQPPSQDASSSMLRPSEGPPYKETEHE